MQVSRTHLHSNSSTISPTVTGNSSTWELIAAPFWETMTTKSTRPISSWSQRIQTTSRTQAWFQIKLATSWWTWLSRDKQEAQVALKTQHLAARLVERSITLPQFEAVTRLTGQERNQFLMLTSGTYTREWPHSTRSHQSTLRSRQLTTRSHKASGLTDTSRLTARTWKTCSHAVTSAPEEWAQTSFQASSSSLTQPTGPTLITWNSTFQKRLSLISVSSNFPQTRSRPRKAPKLKLKDTKRSTVQKEQRAKGIWLTSTFWSRITPKVTQLQCKSSMKSSTRDFIMKLMKSSTSRVTTQETLTSSRLSRDDTSSDSSQKLYPETRITWLTTAQRTRSLSESLFPQSKSKRSSWKMPWPQPLKKCHEATSKRASTLRPSLMETLSITLVTDLSEPNWKRPARPKFWSMWIQSNLFFKI